MFKVRAAQNGFVIEQDDGGLTVCTGDTEAEEFATLLQAILILYGPSHSRYDQERIHITIFPGDKCDKLPAECPLCWQKIPHPAE
jgi:hypothetical protein